jgi:hypothetical protein
VRDFISPAGVGDMSQRILDIMVWDAEFSKRAGVPTYPCLIDREHVVAELYGIVNVPTAVWIDEAGRMVRPPEPAGMSDGFRAMNTATFAVHLGMPIEAIDKTWALVQGAPNVNQDRFCCSICENAAAFRRIFDDLEKFRNGVVHQGDFPSRAKTMVYAERVLNWVAPLYRELLQLAPTGVQAFTDAQEAEIKKTGAHSLAIATIVGRATSAPVRRHADQRRAGLRRCLYGASALRLRKFPLDLLHPLHGRRRPGAVGDRGLRPVRAPIE